MRLSFEEDQATWFYKELNQKGIMHGISDRNYEASKSHKTVCGTQNSFLN